MKAIDYPTRLHTLYITSMSYKLWKIRNGIYRLFTTTDEAFTTRVDLVNIAMDYIRKELRK